MLQRGSCRLPVLAWHVVPAHRHVRVHEAAAGVHDAAVGVHEAASPARLGCATCVGTMPWPPAACVT